ncbi:MAG: fibronectin type III domain-containing protein [Treponema sp.]|nr:fibronectin type III domain-containing protein [Treponema sp.]
MIPYPTNEISNSVISFHAPENLTATQGSFESVTLSWSGVEGAYQYYIYYADSPTQKFIQRGETKGALCSYNVPENPGVTRYYKVRAVKYDGTMSDFSSFVQGSTLAVPVITDIQYDSENGTAEVSWWMKNCSASTYKDSVRYDVRCYGPNKTDLLEEFSVEGDTGSVIFTNLEAATTYYYQVVSYVAEEPTKIEESALLDSTTAHCLVPAAPLDFAAQKGEAKDAVELTWQVPDFVEMYADDGTYEQHPVYFTVSRRIKDSGEEWTVICSYIGCEDENWSKWKNAEVTLYDGDDKITRSAYPAYIPLSSIKYTDTYEVTNGVQYEYKVQSYTDDSEDAVTSDKRSAVTDFGWLCPMPSLSVRAEYESDEESNKYSSLTLSFESAIKSFEDSAEYIFVLEEKKTDFLSAETELVQIKEFNSTIVLNNFVRVFDSAELENSQGYYTYRIYVLKADDADSADDSNYETLSILSAAASGRITVTDDPSLMPKIENFTIEDSFASRYILSWTYDESCVYSLSWNDYDANGNEVSEGSYALTAADVTSASDGSTFTYEHSAPSGTRRLYTLTANKGLEVSKTYDEKVNTLGTAVLSKGTVSYNSISVNFEEVLEADEYELEAEYKDSSEKINFTEEQLTINETEVSGTKHYTFTLTNPAGFDDARKSGKTVCVKIIAKNAKDSTTASLNTRTLGPALVNASIEGFYEKEIDLKWNAVEDAQGYLIFRTKYVYGDDSKWITRSAYCDTYYVSGNTITVNGESSSLAVSNNNGVYLLKDVYSAQTDETSSYQLNQANIIAGYPYGYAIVPVLSSSDFVHNVEDNDELGKAVDVTVKNGSFAYSNLMEAAGSAYGYGLDVKAAKCEDRDGVTVEWKKPYKTPNAATLYKRPAGSAENTWTKVNTNIYATNTSATDTLSSSEKYEAFEYAVLYQVTRSTVNLDPSFINDSQNSGLATVESRAAYNYTGVAQEKQNKGYLMAVPFEARYGGSGNSKRYSENAEWEAWDFEKKSIGPDGYTLYIKNNNISAQWKKVADVAKNGTVSSMQNLTDITLTPNTTSINLEVKGIAAGTSGTTNGMLKVLRDAKHYYKLTARRTYTGSEGEVTAEAELGGAGDIYAYRQITDEELVKGAMLVMAYGFYLDAGGSASLENVNSKMKYEDSKNFSSANGGSASFGEGKYLALEIKYKADVNFVNFAPSMKMPSGDFGSAFKVSTSISAELNNLIAGYYLTKFRDDGCTVTVSALDENIPGNRTLSFTVQTTESKNLTIKAGSTTLVNTNDEGTRRRWFPVQYSDDHSWIADSSYGWWPATN